MVYICMICYIIVTIIILYLNCLFPSFLLLKLKSVFFFNLDRRIGAFVDHLDKHSSNHFATSIWKENLWLSRHYWYRFYFSSFFVVVLHRTLFLSIKCLVENLEHTGWQLESCFRTRGKFKIYHINMTVTTTKKGII